MAEVHIQTPRLSPENPEMAEVSGIYCRANKTPEMDGMAYGFRL